MKRLRHCRIFLFALLLSASVAAAPVVAQESKAACSESYSQHTMNGEMVEDLGTIGLPLRGWIGDSSSGRPVVGMTINAFGEEGKKQLASTVTDGAGAFSFPDLKQGTYYLKGSAKGFIALRILVRVSESANTIACIVE
jgi:hypothetical protein